MQIRFSMDQLLNRMLLICLYLSLMEKKKRAPDAHTAPHTYTVVSSQVVSDLFAAKAISNVQKTLSHCLHNLKLDIFPFQPLHLASTNLITVIITNAAFLSSQRKPQRKQADGLPGQQ